MQYGTAAETTPLLSSSPENHTTQYTLDYSQEPITHVIPNQSGDPTYISTQTSSKCCSGLKNCSMACQSKGGYRSINTRRQSMSDAECSVAIYNNQECCGLGLGCGVNGERGACCRAGSRKAEDEMNDYCTSLSTQPWQYKSIALLCALFLAGKLSDLPDNEKQHPGLTILLQLEAILQLTL
jgi:hypothetical protein